MSKANRCQVYLINMDSRPDRLANVMSRISGLETKIIRVSAVTGGEVKELGSPIFGPANNVANWYSHMKVLNLFLESGDEYCVVLEDDVLFVNSGIEFLNKIIKSSVSGIDILQFGYLTTKGKLDSGQQDKFFRKKMKFKRLLVTLLIAMASRSDVFNRLRVRLNRSERILEMFKLNEQILGLASPLVEGFEAGTHCYLINRKAASVLLNYNKPTLMGADLSLIVLAVARTVLIARTSLSYAIQDDTPVSTGEHSRLKFDLGSIIISAN
jgi:GR25 family glycosyltransferase involved in LPS biosynthesis